MPTIHSQKFLKNLQSTSPLHTLSCLAFSQQSPSGKCICTNISQVSKDENNNIAGNTNIKNTIAQLMSVWGLITIENTKQLDPLAPMRQIKIIPFKEKDKWELCPKYNIGNKN